MLGVQKKIMGNVKTITRYRTFDIKINNTKNYFVSFESSHLVNPFHPHKVENLFKNISEAKKLIDRYWNQF